MVLEQISFWPGIPYMMAVSRQEAMWVFDDLMKSVPDTWGEQESKDTAVGTPGVKDSSREETRGKAAPEAKLNALGFQLLLDLGPVMLHSTYDRSHVFKPACFYSDRLSYFLQLDSFSELLGPLLPDSLVIPSSNEKAN
ncbi:hypothetical protein MG293_000376 [Ovis ammon polii]|uniref:Uncharacterized protein n=1 Tax=Ovis ammon polii TaxID=230172 RepID=A0AAD4UL54_OVIAM|nr:hypothetical protein MG293_000376 [Ovis ammon polii]